MTHWRARFSYVLHCVHRTPAETSLKLDGQPINELNIKEYRKQIALVSQEPTLYAGTVRFNILLGAIKPESEVTEEEIEKACRDANILEFIQSLPEYVMFWEAFECHTHQSQWL